MIIARCIIGLIFLAIIFIIKLKIFIQSKILLESVIKKYSAIWYASRKIKEKVKFVPVDIFDVGILTFEGEDTDIFTIYLNNTKYLDFDFKVIDKVLNKVLEVIQEDLNDTKI